MPFKPNMRDPNGLHMYHAILPPIVVYTDADEANARNQGYQDHYVMREPNQIAQTQAVMRQQTQAPEKGAQ